MLLVAAKERLVLTLGRCRLQETPDSDGLSWRSALGTTASGAHACITCTCSEDKEASRAGSDGLVCCGVRVAAAARRALRASSVACLLNSGWSAQGCSESACSAWRAAILERTSKTEQLMLRHAPVHSQHADLHAYLGLLQHGLSRCTPACRSCASLTVHDGLSEGDKMLHGVIKHLSDYCEGLNSAAAA